MCVMPVYGQTNEIDDEKRVEEDDTKYTQIDWTYGNSVSLRQT